MIIKITLLFLIVIPYARTCSPNVNYRTASLRKKSNSKYVKNEAKDFATVIIPIQTTSREPEIKTKKNLHGEELNCSFEDSENCCWNNAPAAAETRTALWTISTQDNAGKIKMDFQSKQLPSGKFLSVSVDGEFYSRNSAEFVSCPIECSDLDVDVTIKYWLTGDANMKICTRNVNSFANNPLSNCVELPKVHKRNRPTAEVTFPAGENFQVVIVASNLKHNATAAIDDIKVTALPCMTSTSSTTTTEGTTSTSSTTIAPTTTSSTTVVTTTPSLSTICHAVECNFEQSSQCSYKNMHNGSNKLFRKWEVTRGSFWTGLAGIRNAGEGQQYLATYLYPRDVAGVTTHINLPYDYVIRFLIYKSVQKIELMGCCESLSNCPFSTENVADRQKNGYKKWKQESFMCPKGTTKIIFYGYNIGENEGALGLDNIELLLPKARRALYISHKAC